MRDANEQDGLKARLRFGRLHLGSFLVFYAAFAALTFIVLNAGSESDRRENAILLAAVGAVLGPFTGAIARHWQPCCAQFSMSLLPYCAGFLALGVASQFIPIPFQRFERFLRLSLWFAGLAIWFGGGLFSFAHALS